MIKYRAEIRLNITDGLEYGLTLGRFFDLYDVQAMGTADISYQYETIGRPLFDESRDYKFTFIAKECARKRLFDLVDDILEFFACSELITITEKGEG